mmetsp:Transcript_30664/g.57376  ORF Transcript_30664/g.57376 Transcript_30664/m.57376 type:complete len:172 (+) Transcript_30664:71-586(+)
MATAFRGPYLKNPGPCERVPGGFISHQDNEPEPKQVFQSYGAWFQARQPKEQAPTHSIRRTRASTYWPYGAGVTCVVGSHNIHDVLVVDNARSRGCLPHRPEPQKLQTAPAMANSSGLLQRAGSAAALLGGQHEIDVQRKREIYEERMRLRRAADEAAFASYVQQEQVAQG